MDINFEWAEPFLGEPKLREKRNGVKVWDLTMNPYPRHLFHMGRLRFPLKQGWGPIELACAEHIEVTTLTKNLVFKGNIPWRFYQNHFYEKPFDPTVQSIDKFIRKNRLGRERLRKLLAKHKFNGMPDLIGERSRGLDVWEIKAPLDNPKLEKSMAVLTDLSEYGFGANLLCLHEFGKSRTELTQERRQFLSSAQTAYAELIDSDVGKKIYDKIFKPTLDTSIPENSVYQIFSGYERGVSYFVYALVYYIERVMSFYDYQRTLQAFTLTQSEVVYLTRQLYLSGSYHWWRIPLLYMHLVSDHGTNEDYVELIRTAVNWERKFKTSKARGLSRKFFVEYYHLTVSRRRFSSPEAKALAKIQQMRFDWSALYYSKPLR